MDTKRIDKILADLFELDPFLKKKERDIRRIVESLLAVRPDTKFNKKFAQALRADVLSRLAEINNMKMQKNEKTSIDLPQFAYVFVVTMAVFALFMTAAVAPFLKMPAQYSNISVYKKSNGVLIAKVAPNAFGSLSSVLATEDLAIAPVLQNVASEESARVSTINLGLGDGGMSSAPVEKMFADSKMIMPPRESFFQYSYVGDDFSQDESFLPVYKKTSIASDNDFSAVVDAVRQSNFKLFNLDKFKDLKIDNINFKEDRDFGYYFSLSSVNNNFSVYKNWEKWPNSSANCRDDACWQANRIRISDIPTDEELVNIANDFINEYGISLAGFSEPSVQNAWRVAYENTADKENYYLSEEMYIIYPLLINDLEVYDQGGNKYGMTIGVDVRQRKVADVNGLSGLSFETSDYEVINDSVEIIKKAEAGGMNGRWYYSVDEKTTNAKVAGLGTPKKVLVLQWKYDEANKNYEIFVPAYLFPIVSGLEGLDYFYSENIIVPLAKDLYNNDNLPQPYSMIKNNIEVNSTEGAASYISVDQAGVMMK
ncbi:MAG: hypothetical protein WC415_03785 [Patescibacteria group bacterium]|jgi:hypothetical protein